MLTRILTFASPDWSRECSALQNVEGKRAVWHTRRTRLIQNLASERVVKVVDVGIARIRLFVNLFTRARTRMLILDASGSIPNIKNTKGSATNSIRLTMMIARN